MPGENSVLESSTELGAIWEGNGSFPVERAVRELALVDDTVLVLPPLALKGILGEFSLVDDDRFSLQDAGLPVSGVLRRRGSLGSD